MIPFDRTDLIQDWLETGSVNFFGRPFAGKDNQSVRLAERFNGRYLSGGHILRTSQTIPKGDLSTINDGSLVRTSTYFDQVLPVLSDPDYKDQPLFLSAVGRKHGEEARIVDTLEKAGHPLRAVVHLVFSEEEARQRLGIMENRQERGNRVDDELGKLEERFRAFNAETLPVIEYYREKGVVIDVDASLSKDEVELEILNKLAHRAETPLSRASTSP